MREERMRVGNSESEMLEHAPHPSPSSPPHHPLVAWTWAGMSLEYF